MKKHVQFDSETEYKISGFDGVIDEESKLTEEEAIELGLTPELYDIEEDWNGNFWLMGHAPEKPIEKKQADARAVRDVYFSQYVDWYQSKPLLWAEMSEREKNDIENYKEYLKHYTDAPEWWEENPKTFDEWKAVNNGE